MMVIDDQQRAQLIDLMFKHKDLWIARQLWNLGCEYGSTRMCVNNRSVNKLTITNAYPIPESNMFSNGSTHGYVFHDLGKA